MNQRDVREVLGQLGGELYDAFLQGHTADIPVDCNPILAKYADLLTAAAAEHAAGELDAQADFYRDGAELFAGPKDAALELGDEDESAVLAMQARTLRDVAARLRRRAVSVRGMTADEVAARDQLTAPAAPVELPPGTPEGEKEGNQ